MSALSSKDKLKLYWLVHDLTIGYPFLRYNLGLTRMDIIKCNLKGECY